MTYQFPDLLPVLGEHLSDNDGEVLPHLLMGDFVRWMVAHKDVQAGEVRSMLDWLEAAYAIGDEDVRDVIAVSGVEMIPDPGQTGAELRGMLGRHLAAVDPWKQEPQ